MNIDTHAHSQRETFDTGVHTHRDTNLYSHKGTERQIHSFVHKLINLCRDTDKQAERVRKRYTGREHIYIYTNQHTERHRGRPSQTHTHTQSPHE